MRRTSEIYLAIKPKVCPGDDQRRDFFVMAGVERSMLDGANSADRRHHRRVFLNAA
jgi:hypothetical protein